MVGIALLTLAPGRMGGSEGYARGLAAALARWGDLEYLVARPARPAGRGRRAAVSRGRCAVDAAGARARSFAAPPPRRALAGRSTVVHYPLTVPVPLTRRPRVVTLHDVLHLDYPELVPPRVRAFRRAGVRPGGADAPTA